MYGDETETEMSPGTIAARAKEIPKSIHPIDVLVITPLVKEQIPALVAFGIDHKVDPERNIDGRRIFFAKVDRPDGPLNIALAAIARPRNVPAAIGTLDLIAALAPSEAVIMAGIGGGLETKVKLGDIAYGSMVIDIAGGREEVDGTKPRPEPFRPPIPIARHLDYFMPEAGPWRKSKIELSQNLRELGFLIPPEETLEAAELKDEEGIIVAGEKLMADGKLQDYLKHDQRIISCDMEGSGFAQACHDRKQWLIFRGISDYGDPDKTNEWQAFAAGAASLTVREFLTTQFVRGKDVETQF